MFVLGCITHIPIGSTGSAGTAGSAGGALLVLLAASEANTTATRGLLANLRSLPTYSGVVRGRACARAVRVEHTSSLSSELSVSVSVSVSSNDGRLPACRSARYAYSDWRTGCSNACASAGSSAGNRGTAADVVVMTAPADVVKSFGSTHEAALEGCAISPISVLPFWCALINNKTLLPLLEKNWCGVVNVGVVCGVVGVGVACNCQTRPSPEIESKVRSCTSVRTGRCRQDATAQGSGGWRSRRQARGRRSLASTN